MFKSNRKGGRIAAATIGIVAALTPLAAPPAALADGLPTPELEKSLTVDVEGEDPSAWFTDDGNYAIIADYDYDLEITITAIMYITVIHGLILRAVKSLLSTYRNPAYPMFRVLGTTSIFIGWRTARSSSIPSKINNGSPTLYR